MLPPSLRHILQCALIRNAATYASAALLLQLAAFIYFIYWELSWDVMEPVGYLLGLAYSCAAYFYFLVTRGNMLDYGPFEEYWTQQQLVSEACFTWHTHSLHVVACRASLHTC